MPPINLKDPLVTVILTALQQYVVAKPDATQTELVLFIMSFDQPQAIAEEGLALIGDKLEELHGYRLSFEEVKAEAIAANGIPVEEIDLTEIS